MNLTTPLFGLRSDCHRQSGMEIASPSKGAGAVQFVMTPFEGGGTKCRGLSVQAFPICTVLMVPARVDVGIDPYRF